jgi:hypothetical protein
MGGNKKERDIL